jgi:AAA15 family ATPase/GTPase
MIHKLSFSDFYSFKDKVTIDFTVDGNAPDTDAYFTDTYGNRVSKIMTVIGANASGKTNLLKSVAFLKWFIVDSFSSLGPQDKISRGFKPFLFCAETGISNFEITFCIVDEIYEYKLGLTSERVVSESLKVKNKETNKWNSVFTRQLRENGTGYDMTFTKLDLPSDFDKIVRGNSSVLSAAKQINNLSAVKIVNYFSKIHTSFDEMGDPSKNTYQSIYDTAEYFQNNQSIKEKAGKILQRFDLGISKFSIEKGVKSNDNSTIYLPMAYHKHVEGDKETRLMMYEESGGTRNLFLLLRDILSALEAGNSVIFDELDNNLHPLMVPEIINLFKSKNHNPKNAQLFFSTHNVQILSELDKQQIVIVEKENNVSEAWKLNDIEGVRPDENYYTKYLAGVYGGIPKF